MKTLLLASCVVAAVLLAAQCEAKKSVQLTEEDVGYCTKSKRGEAHITEWRNTTVDINYGADVKVVPAEASRLREGTRQAVERFKRSNAKAEKRKHKKRKNKKARKEKKDKQKAAAASASSTAAPPTRRR
ncbi:hypothetical protein M3Y99_00158900 [Aphelenchoides fujianensis]|nr:hypothetical protein M3Y99_00158900 [Aphelenchoides fujianensis]